MKDLCKKCGGKMHSTTVGREILLICKICMYSKIIIIKKEKETGAEDRI